MPLDLKKLWDVTGFKPTEEQKKAIFHDGGPLFLQAGPGSGKTRVLLWRTVNLIVNGGVHPEEIFLSTFTEKAALQLQEGLRSLLNLASGYTGQPYDISKMYIGTVHSLCQRMMTDRRLTPSRTRPEVPTLYDDLDQYFYLGRKSCWEKITACSEFQPNPHEAITTLLGERRPSKSKHKALERVISLFNRVAEECLDVDDACKSCSDPALKSLLSAYTTYRVELSEQKIADFAHIQHSAFELLTTDPQTKNVFKHVVIDEYQDTNPIQEKIFFSLAAGHKNICVVGDDDQALYRFRGATVENFVNFPTRCKQYLEIEPTAIRLVRNYRSLPSIVSFYNAFILNGTWKKAGKAYRIDKEIIAARDGKCVTTVASAPGTPENIADEIAKLVDKLIKTKKVSDPNQIAFLFPSLQSPHVEKMRSALETLGHQVYAPRAGRFLEVAESQPMFGLMFHLFGKPSHHENMFGEYQEFHAWVDDCYREATTLIKNDAQLKEYLTEAKSQINASISDHTALVAQLESHGWDVKTPYNSTMRQTIVQTAGLSRKAKTSLSSIYLERYVESRKKAGLETALGYILNRATALDWDILDVFYRLCGFEYFKAMFELAENGTDEGPICNLSIISQYLDKFMDMSGSYILTPDRLKDNNFANYFGNYLYVLYRKGESEYEDANDPFPRGRIPFLTIHQSKGLEFPVVILANPRKNENPQAIETLLRPFIRRDGEPLELMPHFDVMRMFYVALSRAQNLLVIAHFKGRGQSVHDAFKPFLENAKFPRIKDLDLKALPSATITKTELPQTYSYTMDYLGYQKCPRNYMIFRKYGFTPSRSQTAFFGSLVHQTLEDIHNHLISRKVTK